MSDKHWYEGGWTVNRTIAGGAFQYYGPGMYVDGVEEEPTYTIPERAISRGLVALLESEGYLKPRLDERLRTEDLKITHRLLDLLEGKLPSNSASPK